MFFKTKLPLFTLIGICLFSFAHAQKPKVQNLPRYDSDNFHLGYTLGFNSGDFSIRNSDVFFDTSFDVYSIEAKQSMGFQFGAISNFHLGEYFDLRFLLYASFHQRDLEYTLLKDTADNKFVFEKYNMPLSSTFLEMPILLKYKSKRINNYRFYVIGGITPKLDPVHIIKTEYIDPNKPQIRLEPYDLLGEIGFGLDIYTTYFKFSPEIKYGIGLIDVAQPDNTVYSKSLGYLKSRMIMFSFHFE